MMVTFFNELVAVLHGSEVLYKDKDCMDNLLSWLSSMSSSQLRPFRHTATTISLAVTSGLVEVAQILDMRITDDGALVQKSKKSKNKNKEAEASLKASQENRTFCGALIQSFFDTVFVHRYRDTDPKIRAECVEALGHWISELPNVFMDPSYLRYLGWMLSDTSPVTRAEVLRQLLRVFQTDASALGHFIDRFKSRLIEMATRDAEVSVRVAAISVVDVLRGAALLEPNDVDAIGELIFDTEIRIRKAVVSFFSALVEDVYEQKVDALGGVDVLRELPNVDEDDYDSLQEDWVDIKCLAESLAHYDSQIEERQQSTNSEGVPAHLDLLGSAQLDTRISLAAQVLFDKVDVVNKWRQLAGYLLFDHTTNTKSKSRSKGAKTPESVLKKAVAPTSAEEVILLNVLASAVKTHLAHTVEMEQGRRKGGKSEAAEVQEAIATDLAAIIPPLLNKFGAVSETATTVLKLEHMLNLGIFTQLGQESQYENLLDEICTQFNRHDDNMVISEVATALVHARQHEELEELADTRLSTLWENNINSLRNIENTCEVSVRGNLSEDTLQILSATVMKISKLAGISDCVDVLDAEGSGDSTSPTIELLINLVQRGHFEPQDDEAIDVLEDELVSYAIKACQFYFMWRVRATAKMVTEEVAIPPTDVDRLSYLCALYRKNLVQTFSSRANIDDLRLFATGSFCDVHVTFAVLRSPLKHNVAASDLLQPLMCDIEPSLTPELLDIFGAAEKDYAKKTRRYKALNPPAEDEDPVEEEEDLDEDDDEDLSQEEKLAAELKSEKALCEITGKLVLAITAKCLDVRGRDAGKLKKRLQRNQAKLGNNFKEVVAYLDAEKALRKKAAASSKSAAAAAAVAAKKKQEEEQRQQQQEQEQLSKEIIDDDDDIFSDSDKGERRDEVEDDPIEDVESDEEPERGLTRDESVLGD